MRKYLTKQEIIEKLQSLPDLPVVRELDCDSIRAEGISAITVRKAIRQPQYGNRYTDLTDEGGIEEDVIWIA